MTELDVLWRPIDIGGVTVKNRVFVPAHEPYLSIGGESGNLMGDRHISYLEERAKGGAGLVMAGGASVHPHGEHFGHMPIYDPECIPRYRSLAEKVHPHDTKVFVQLFHCGVQDPGNERLENWHAPIGPSAKPSPVYLRVAKPMDKDDIAAAIEGFATSAANMKEAGIDGVEIGGGHGYLLGQFLSPIYNERDDEYGGSLENRCRIVIEIAEAIRDRVGPDYPIGIRVSYDEFMGEVGVDADDGDEIVRILNATGLFDYFNVSGITYHTFHFLAAPMTAQKDAHFVPNAVRAKKVVENKIPVLVASVIKDIDRCAQVIGDGEADLVGMTRAHIADPNIVKKAQEGKKDEIRRCVGANQGCIRRYIHHNMVTCTVNPEVGREVNGWTSEAEQAGESRKVLIVGGGPAGLKAAESAAERSHEVTLVDRGESLGGALHLAGALPDRERWLDLAADLERRLQVLGVDVQLGREMSADEVREFGADLAVIATGSDFDKGGWSIFMPGREGIPGADQAHVLTPAEAIEDPSRCGERVVIFDENADHLPNGLALLLTGLGKKVEIISSQMFAGQGLMVTNDLAWVYPKLVEAGVDITAQHAIGQINADSVDVMSIWGAGERNIPADTVVLCMTRHAETGLYDELAADHDGFAVERIGDCVSPREVDDAIYEGAALGRRVEEIIGADSGAANKERSIAR
jgi:2,4-dienoyl-CoA reductase-like NADH-dependent reductase (Old Yellow Enzyme family)